MKRMTIFFLFAALLITLPQIAFSGAFEPPRDGATIFRAVCASCHGYTGTGNNGGYTSFVNEEPAFDISFRSGLAGFIRGGRTPQMPGFSPEEISDNEVTTLETCVGSGSCIGANIYPDPAYQASIWLQDEPPWFACDPTKLAAGRSCPSDYVVNVNVGDTVRFVNRGQTWHTATQGDFLVAASPTSGQKNSGLIGRGGKWFPTFTTSGVNYFYCMLHPFMQVEVCVGTTCSNVTHTTPTARATPTQPGVGELWVAAQFQDMNGTGKPTDPGVGIDNNGNPSIAAYPDLATNFDDFVKPGEIEVVDLANYSITQAPSPATNPFNNPHYIWGRATKNGVPAPEMVIDNYFDNYKSFMSGTTKAMTLSVLTWGATASHTTSQFAGGRFYAPVQGDWGIQTIRPGNQIGSWSVGGITRLDIVDSTGHFGSMPHGIWAGGSGGTIVQTANSRSNNAGVFDDTTLRANCTRPPVTFGAGTYFAAGTYGGFPLNSGITTSGSIYSTTNVGNPTTFSTSITLNLGVTTGRRGNPCGTSVENIPLPGEGAVQTPPSPDDKYIAISNGPYMTIIPLTAMTFLAGSTCTSPIADTKAGFHTSPSGRQVCNLNVDQPGAHGVAWGLRAAGTGNGWRIYMAAKFTNKVSVVDLIENTNGTVSISSPGDIALIARNGAGIQALAGVATTGGEGVTTRPLPPPWQ